MQTFAKATIFGGVSLGNVVDKLDFTKPIVRRKIISASNDSSMATHIKIEGFEDLVFDEPSQHGGSDLGPTPLTGVLSALCACEAVTFNRTAAEFDFDYSGIEFSAAFTIDIRGRSGVRGVVPHFQSVKVEAQVSTYASMTDLEKVVEETEARCPVYNLIRDAGVKVETVWIRKTS